MSRQWKDCPVRLYHWLKYKVQPDLHFGPQPFGCEMHFRHFRWRLSFNRAASSCGEPFREFQSCRRNFGSELDIYGTCSRRHRCERFTKCRTSQRYRIFSSQLGGRKMIAGTSISPWSADEKNVRTYLLTRRNRLASPLATYRRRFYDGGSGEYGISSRDRMFLWNRLLLSTCVYRMYDYRTGLAESWRSNAGAEVVLETCECTRLNCQERIAFMWGKRTRRIVTKKRR